jgi:5'-3' exonuclease
MSIESPKRPPPAKLMLLDTASLYFRAFFGVPDTVRSRDGQPVNAVRGLLDFIARLVADHAPTHLVACMDADWRPEFRVAAIPTYKAHRVAHPGSAEEEVPDALSPQVPVIEAVLDALGIARVGVPGYEADDVIGTLTHVTPGAVDVVTGDRDLFQLVDDERPVRILYTARGVGRLEVVDEAWVARKYGVPGRAYADFATLRGDPSDGLPGVKGVGDKTAAALITQWGSLEALLAAVDDPTVDVGARGKLEASRDYLAVAPLVVQVAADAPMPDNLDTRIPQAPADPEALLELSDRWNLESPVNRVLNVLATLS